MLIELHTWLLILASTVAVMALGFLWYGPLFGKPWMALMGLTEQKISEMKRTGMARTYLFSLLGTLLQNTVLVVFVNATGAQNAVQGIIVAVLLWLGLVFTTQLNQVLYEQKPFRLFLISTGHQLVLLVVAGAIFGQYL